MIFFYISKTMWYHSLTFFFMFSPLAILQSFFLSYSDVLEYDQSLLPFPHILLTSIIIHSFSLILLQFTCEMAFQAATSSSSSSPPLHNFSACSTMAAVTPSWCSFLLLPTQFLPSSLPPSLPPSQPRMLPEEGVRWAQLVTAQGFP